MSAIRLFFSFFFIVLLAACGPSAERQAVVLQGKTMGTTYTVKYLSDGLKDLPPPEQVQADLDKLLVEVNRQMSTYDPSSEISRFNQLQTVGEPMEISADFAFVTAEAFRLNGLTQGALDVTVGPLVNLWGFGPDKTVTREPTAEQIRQASAVVGTDKIILAGGSGKQTLAKKVAGTYLDLSSIARARQKRTWRNLAHRHRAAADPARRQYANRRSAGKSFAGHFGRLPQFLCRRARQAVVAYYRPAKACPYQPQPRLRQRDCRQRDHRRRPFHRLVRIGRAARPAACRTAGFGGILDYPRRQRLPHGNVFRIQTTATRQG